MKPIVSLAALLLLNSCCAFRSNCKPAAAAATPAAAPAAAASEVEYKVVPLRFARADDLAKALRSSIAVQPGRNAPKIVSDDRTNSVIITCAPDELPVIEKLIAQLDVEVKRQ